MGIICVSANRLHVPEIWICVHSNTGNYRIMSPTPFRIGGKDFDVATRRLYEVFLSNLSRAIRTDPLTKPQASKSSALPLLKYRQTHRRA